MKADINSFPISIEVTNDIDFNKSIGTQLLTKLFPDSEIFWGLSIGNVDGFLIKTENEVPYNGTKHIVPHYLQQSEIKIGMTITFLKRKKIVNYS